MLLVQYDMFVTSLYHFFIIPQLRKGVTLEEAEKRLAPNLSYDPERE
jgi:hypothetical protein